MIFITGGIQTLLGCTQGLVSSLPDYPPSSPRGIPQPIHTGAVPLQCGQPGPGDWCNTSQLNALTRWLSTHTSSPLPRHCMSCRQCRLPSHSLQHVPRLCTTSCVALCSYSLVFTMITLHLSNNVIAIQACHTRHSPGCIQPGST